MAGQGADSEGGRVVAHVVEGVDPIDVDQRGGPGQAEIHRWDEALPPGQDFALLAVLREQIERLLERARRKILKRGRFHLRSSGGPVGRSATLIAHSIKSMFLAGWTAGPLARTFGSAVTLASRDPPPVKWSTLSYGFCSKEDRDAEKELQAGGDRRQAAPG